MRLLISLTAFLLVQATIGQNIETTFGVKAGGYFSSEDVLPAWFFTNNHQALGVLSNFSGEINGVARYKIGDATLEAGTAWFYRDDVEDEFQRKDLYLQFKNNWLEVTAGAKAWPEAVHGLSMTNKNFLWSLNSRPLGGLLAQASNPLKISETFAMDWGIAHYALNDDRYVENTNVHYKRLGVFINFNENHKLHLRLQHFAQWGGTSPDFGDLPNDFSAYIDVFFARENAETGEENELENAVGNHLGSYFIQYDFLTSIGAFAIYHEHPFEDGSGTRLVNVPDGVYGLQWSPKEKKIVEMIVYEYLDTSDQSGRDGGRGFDGYFGNSVYRSGWSYEKNILGFPFFIYDRELVLDGVNSPIASNSTKAHNLGIAGTAYGVHWRFKTTYVRNSGTLRQPFDVPLKNWLNYASFTYPTKDYGNFTLMLGADFNNIADDVFGAGIQYSYLF